MAEKKEPKEEPREDRNDVEQERGMLHLAMSFGNQIFASATDVASVSSLGSQVFGTSEITHAVNSELYRREEAIAPKQNVNRSHPGIQDALRRNEEAGPRMQATEEERHDQPLEIKPFYTGTFSGGTFDHIVRSFTGMGVTPETPETPETPDAVEAPVVTEVPEVSNAAPNSGMLSAEQIAEQELKSREHYITATRERQALRRSGLAEDSPQMKQSEKMLRDCYAEIEYWECLGEESSKNNNGSQNSGGLRGKFLGCDPMNAQPVDVDQETTKARDAYAYAMTCHQALVRRKVYTSSPEWVDSQNRINDALNNLQYWESRSAFAVPPSI